MPPYEPEPTPPNVGRVDAFARFVAGPLLIFAGGYGVVALGPDWAISMIHPVILGVYLMLTAAIRTDFLYMVTGWNTRREAREARLREHRRTGRGRAA